LPQITLIITDLIFLKSENLWLNLVLTTFRSGVNI